MSAGTGADRAWCTSILDVGSGVAQLLDSPRPSRRQLDVSEPTVAFLRLNHGRRRWRQALGRTFGEEGVKPPRVWVVNGRPPKGLAAHAVCGGSVVDDVEHVDEQGWSLMGSYTSRDVVRGFVPLGALEVLRAKRRFEAFGCTSVRAWWNALSPTREMLDRSNLAHVPPGILRSPSLCVVDVGANVGDWSGAVIRAVGPSKLIAIEPAPQLFTTLQSRFGHRPTVKLVNAAAGERRETAKLRMMSSHDFTSLLDLREEIASQYEQPLHTVAETDTEVIPLDELLADVPEVSILKVDVQGAEWAVLSGAVGVLRRTQSVILEVNFLSHYEGDRLFCDLHSRMTEELGFTLTGLFRPYNAPDGALLRADAIYARLPCVKN